MARDNHFKQAAVNLYREILVTSTREEAETLLAQRLFDVACHTLNSTAYGFDLFNIPERVETDVPDITTWGK